MDGEGAPRTRPVGKGREQNADEFRLRVRFQLLEDGVGTPADERIPADEFAAFIDGRFARTGLRPEPGLGAAIVELAGNLPYDVQRLALNMVS